MATRVLFISPHPDDETIGCGGTILKNKEIGHEIFWLIMTCGLEKDGFPKDEIENMANQVEVVSSRYKFDYVKRLNYPSTKLETIPIMEMVEVVYSILKKLEPQIVYINHRDDVHSDHKIVFDVVWSCLKSFKCSFIKEINSYETLSETEFVPPFQSSAFVPNVFCNISDYLPEKLEIMKIYKSEIKPHPFPRSLENLEALAIFRGATIGVKFAEAFMCLKRII